MVDRACVKAKGINLALLLLTAFVCRGQEVFEPRWKSSYDFMERMAMRGQIDFQDVIQPVTRKYIYEKLGELHENQEELTLLEKKELAFYLKDYKFDSYTLDSMKRTGSFRAFFTSGDADRFRPVSWYAAGFGVNIQPVLGAEFRTIDTKQNFVRNSGLSIYGFVKRRFAYSFSFRETAENGNGIDSLKSFTPEPGVILSGPKSRYQYSDFRTQISYSWDWGSLSMGRDQLLWGYGSEGRLVLSQKAPAYPFIRLDVHPAPWLWFNMTHASLNSMVPDSATVRPTKIEIDQLDFFRKSMAVHSFILRPVRGLYVAFGESIIYNNRLKLGYLVPLAFFRAQSHYEGEGNNNPTLSNSQFFLQLSSRNHIPKTQLYFIFFVDEMSFSKFFDKKEMRNQTGYTGGISVTNFPLRNLYFSTEYTRTRPYAYQHFVPYQTYTNNSYNLGHWIGSNADQWVSRIRYRVRRGLTAELRMNLVRKGSVPTDSTFNQYERGTPFLWGEVKRYKLITASARYELIHDFFLEASWQQQAVSTNLMNIGIRYGF